MTTKSEKRVGILAEKKFITQLEMCFHDTGFY